MDEQKPPQQDSEHPDGGALPTETIKPHNPAPAPPRPTHQLAEVQKELSGFEKSTLRWARTAVILSAFAALFVCAQWWEMRKGGNDTHNLATAAGNQATWTQNLAGAAGTQAAWTQDMANHMKDQADRTKDLADHMEASVKEETRLATATEAANANAFNADRPWIGMTINVGNFVKDGHPTIEYITTNSGRRPALILKAETGYMEATRLPIIPPYGNISFQSRSIELPGERTIHRNVLNEGLLTEEQLRRLDAGAHHFFAYGSVQYEDIASHKVHWTHACVVYAPKTTNSSAEFYNCTNYNETDE